MFQSTPAIADGRTRDAAKVIFRDKVFQSTPAIADGRTLLDEVIWEHKLLFQSTPAIADGRTTCRATPKIPCWSFNPRPPSLTGEPALDGGSSTGLQFQSTPAIADGRTGRRPGL